MTRKGLIYLIGIFIFGLIYSWLKSTFDNAITFIISILFLICLRIFAEKLGK